MAAARPDNGTKQNDTAIMPNQRPKPALPPPNGYPMIFLNARKEATSVLPSRPQVLRRLASVQPRRVAQDAPSQPAAMATTVPLKPRTESSTKSAGPVLLNADTLRRTVYSTLPTVTLHSGTTTTVNGLNTIVSFAGKPAITIPVPSTDLITVVRPAPGAALTKAPVSSAGTTMYSFSKLANASPTVPTRTTTVAKLVARNGERTPEPMAVKPAGSGPNGASGRSPIRYNNAPGWRRILRNKVIVYISPSNTVLHNFDQVKEYLLSSGTCKCGLPCPFYPEVFFQFDAQIPNLTIATGGKRAASCTHLQPPVAGSERTKRVHAEAIAPTSVVQRTQSAILLKTPPWRKNVPSASSSPSGVSAASLQSSPGKANTATEGSPDATQARTAKVARVPTSSGAVCAREQPPEQKKPTFKDDPTGYLNQQTAILHSSISILHSPDRRSPLPSTGLSPALNGKDGIQPKDDRPGARRMRMANSGAPSVPKPVSTVLRFEPEPPKPPGSSIKPTGSTEPVGRTVPIARISTPNRGKMAYYVQANASAPVEQGSSAKVAKLIIPVAPDTVPAVPTPCTTSMTTTTTTATTVTTTTVTRTHPTAAATAAPGTMLLPTRSSHVINTGGAQIVVIDGLQNSAAELNRVRLAGFHPARPQPAPGPTQPAPTVLQAVTKPPPVPTTMVNYGISRAPNGTATSTAMLLNGTNIIHLSNGLSSFGGLLASTSPGATAATTQCLSQDSPAAKSPLALANGPLGLPPGSTVVLNPTTSIRFADSSSFPAPAGTVTSGFGKPPCTGTTFPYASSSEGPSGDVTGPRKVKRMLKGTLPNGTTGLGGGTFLSTPGTVTSLAQGPATFPHQLPAGSFVQIASPYGGLQNIQLAPSLSGITVVPVTKSAPLLLPSPTAAPPGPSPQPQQHPSPAPQPPYGLLGSTQTILLPAGSMVMASDTSTLLQIQNMAPCTSNGPLIGAQTGIVLRQPKHPATPSGFLSTISQPSFLIGGNGSPGPARSPTVPQRPLSAASGTTSLFGAGLVTTQPLTVGNVTLQQPQLTLTNGTDASKPAKSPSRTGTVLLHVDTTNHADKPREHDGGRVDLKPEGSMSIRCSEPDVTSLEGIALLASAEHKQPWREATKQPGVPAHPEPLAGTGKDPGRVGTVAQRRVPTTKAPASVKLSLTVPPSTSDAASLCLLAELPEQTYDAAVPPGSVKAPARGRKRRRTALAQRPTVSATSNEPDCDVPECADTGTDAGPGRQFRVGDLVWGAVRGFPAWPGKVLPFPGATPTAGATDRRPPNEGDPSPKPDPPLDGPVPEEGHVWVRWFGPGRSNSERVDVSTLQSLSEGLEAHHRAQKDARKSRKLNAQLEQAIQQAMQELDDAGPESGFNRRGGSTIGRQQQQQQQRRRRRRPPQRPQPSRRRTSGPGSRRNRRPGSVRYLRGNKFKAKS